MPIDPLFRIAIQAGSVPAVRLQLTRGVDIHGSDSDGCTPLMIAAERGFGLVCRLLLDAGADIAARDKQGRDALAIAVAKQQAAVSALLRRELAARESSDVYARREQVDVIAVRLGDETADEWEACEDTPPPPENSAMLDGAVRLQQGLSAHEVIDRRESWDDLKVDLPAVTRRSRYTRLTSTQRARLHHDSLASSLKDLFIQGLNCGWVTTGQITDALSEAVERPVELRRLVEVALGELDVHVSEEYFEQDGGRYKVHWSSLRLAAEAVAFIMETR